MTLSILGWTFIRQRSRIPFWIPPASVWQNSVCPDSSGDPDCGIARPGPHDSRISGAGGPLRRVACFSAPVRWVVSGNPTNQELTTGSPGVDQTFLGGVFFICIVRKFVESVHP
jgi:hypothetical protein